MKKLSSGVFVKAAWLIDRDFLRFSCLALDYVSGYSNVSRWSPHAVEFTKIYSLDSIYGNSFSYPGGINGEKELVYLQREHRVFALLFAAEFVKSEQRR